MAFFKCYEFIAIDRSINNYLKLSKKIRILSFSPIKKNINKDLLIGVYDDKTKIEEFYINPIKKIKIKSKYLNNLEKDKLSKYLSIYGNILLEYQLFRINYQEYVERMSYMNLSKSKYTTGVTCEKKLWLSCYKPEEAEETRNIFLESGKRVGEFARSLFGEYVLIENQEYPKMIEETNKALEKKNNIICEASFSYNGNFCSVDILRNLEEGVEIYEVKSSTKIEKIYLDDISYQTWVLKKCGINVKKSFIVYINDEFIKNGDIDLKEFFKIEDVTDDIDLDSVEDNVNDLKKIVNSDKESNIDLSMSCHEPYDCPFFKYCTRCLPSPNVFDIGWKFNFDKKLEIYKRGNITFEDIIDKEKVNKKGTEQIRFVLENKKEIINKDNIEELLDKFRYPLYFLDFESYQNAIPTIDGTKPYQQICFQYSLHYYLEEDKELLHKEFLSDDYDGNPMYGLCKQLCEDIPKDSCVIVYNKTFECTRLKEMAEMFPEFRDHLLNISDNIVDIMVPFFNQDYYVKEMGGRWSIKVVLPALFPNDPSLDYHNLKQVHKGDEASDAFLSLPNKTKEEQEELRKNMLEYCKLDTFAMVKIYEKLREVVNK